MKKNRVALSALCVLAASVMAASSAQGAIEVLSTTFAPEVGGSTGTGFGVFTYDDAAHTLRIQASFSGLAGVTTVAHIHGNTATPFTGTAGVIVLPPSLPLWPVGVTSGSYDQLIDLTLASSFSAAYVTANGGTLAGAESALLGAMRTGRAYFNIHTSFAGGGEIRGFVPGPGAAALLGLGGLMVSRRRR